MVLKSFLRKTKTLFNVANQIIKTMSTDELPISSQDFRNTNYKAIPVVYHMIEMDKRILFDRFFGDVSDRLKIDKQVGFLITKDTIHIPYQLPSIEHEIAHLVEMKDSKRWTMTDFGMGNPDIDHMSAERIFQALSREVRARAIELHLTGKIIKSDSKYMIFNNPFWYSAVKKHLPFGKFKNMDEVTAWVEDLRDKTYAAWSEDRVVHEWKIRLEHIQNHMESNLN